MGKTPRYIERLGAGVFPYAEKYNLRKRGNVIMKFGFKQKPGIRSMRSRLVNACKIASRGFGSFFAFIRTRTFALTFYICISMAVIMFIMLNTKIVQVVDGGSAKYIYTFRTSKVSILKQCGITLKSDDQSYLSAFTSNFAKLDFYPAFSVKVTADNKTQNIILAKGTVSDVLQKAGITLGENDEINDPVDLTVSSGTNIVIKRVVYKTVTQDSSIGYATITTQTTLLKKNSQKVIVRGQNGVSEIISKETYIDGVLTDQQVISQNVVSQPVSCSMLVGTAANTPISPLVPPSNFILSSNGTPLKYSKVIHGTATGYSPVDGKYCSTDHIAQVGYVAVNPDVIPYGTALYIITPDGSVVYGYAKAYDTGGFVNNGSGVTVDLYFNTYNETDIFGKRHVDIYVLS